MAVFPRCQPECSGRPDGSPSVLSVTPDHVMSSQYIPAPGVLAFGGWRVHPCWRPLSPVLSVEAPITAPSLPVRPALATGSGGQCLAGSPPAGPLTCLRPDAPLGELTHSAPPASPRLALPVPLAPLVLYCLPCRTRRLSGQGIQRHQVHCGPSPRQPLGRSAAWDRCIRRLGPCSLLAAVSLRSPPPATTAPPR